MVLNPHLIQTFTPNRDFVGREEPLEDFLHAYRLEQTKDDYRILCWHGVGGQGKTTLLEEMRRRIESSDNTAIARLDFKNESHRNPETALLKVRGDFARQGFKFPTFDFVFVLYFSLNRPLEDIYQVYPKLFRKGESEVVNDLLDMSEGELGELAKDILVDVSKIIPGLNLIYKYGARFVSNSLKKFEDNKVKARLQDLNTDNPNELLAKMPLFLGIDIQRALEAHDYHRLVLTVDTHEGLARGELQADAWFRYLVQSIPGVLVVIMGRDKLRWAELEAEWQEHLQQTALPKLGDEEADTFLINVPVDEPEIRQQLIHATKGLPLYLDLAVDTYAGIRNRGETPKVGDFGQTRTEVLDRFLNHLPESERKALYVASYPETLTEQLFVDLTKKATGGGANYNWADLLRRSFIREDDSGRHVMHDLMREELQKKDRIERPVVYQELHSFLFERYSDPERAFVSKKREFSNETEHALLAACYHSQNLGYDSLLDWMKVAVEPTYAIGKLALLKPWLCLLLEATPEATDNRAWGLFALARANLGDAAMDPLPYLQESLDIYQNVNGRNSLECVRVLRSLGLSVAGHDAELARSSLEDALARCRATLDGQHPEHLEVLKSLGVVARRTGDLSYAADQFQCIVDQTSDHPELAEQRVNALDTLSNIRRDQRASESQAECLKDLLDELDRSQSVKLALKASALDRYAEVLTKIDRPDEARQISDRMIASYKDLFLQEWNTPEASNTLVKLLKHRPNDIGIVKTVRHWVSSFGKFPGAANALEALLNRDAAGPDDVETALSWIDDNPDLSSVTNLYCKLVRLPQAQSYNIDERAMNWVSQRIERSDLGNLLNYLVKRTEVQDAAVNASRTWLEKRTYVKVHYELVRELLAHAEDGDDVAVTCAFDYLETDMHPQARANIFQSLLSNPKTMNDVRQWAFDRFKDGAHTEEVNHFLPHLLDQGNLCDDSAQAVLRVLESYDPKDLSGRIFRGLPKVSRDKNQIKNAVERFIEASPPVSDQVLALRGMLEQDHHLNAGVQIVFDWLNAFDGEDENSQQIVDVVLQSVMGPAANLHQDWRDTAERKFSPSNASVCNLIYACILVASEERTEPLRETLVSWSDGLTYAFTGEVLKFLALGWPEDPEVARLIERYIQRPEALKKRTDLMVTWIRSGGPEGSGLAYLLRAKVALPLTGKGSFEEMELQDKFFFINSLALNSVVVMDALRFFVHTENQTFIDELAFLISKINPNHYSGDGSDPCPSFGRICLDNMDAWPVGKENWIWRPVLLDTRLETTCYRVHLRGYFDRLIEGCSQLGNSSWHRDAYINLTRALTDAQQSSAELLDFLPAIVRNDVETIRNGGRL
ncbi:tetratricopeptide repeat protein [Ruegeria sp.]|uniref:tetratricopeptide repeat protein n=1 Tax=Ruegeria sp. TaxID=1879320 RepID=UPI00230A5591|nr:tetratricopeptide repeat protein [Ruegeria sp.]MDA7964647.1 tetratricopeptide repeat protein [Ruegeria sp.]